MFTEEEKEYIESNLLLNNSNSRIGKEILRKIEGNPVLPLGKKHIEALNKVYETSDCTNQEILDLADEAISFLESSVETNREYPKCSCKHDNTETLYTKEFCTICNLQVLD